MSKRCLFAKRMYSLVVFSVRVCGYIGQNISVYHFGIKKNMFYSVCGSSAQKSSNRSTIRPKTMDHFSPSFSVVFFGKIYDFRKFSVPGAFTTINRLPKCARAGVQKKCAKSVQQKYTTHVPKCPKSEQTNNQKVFQKCAKSVQTNVQPTTKSKLIILLKQVVIFLRSF